MIVITYSVLIPEEAFLFPDVLRAQYENIVRETNVVRAGEGLPALALVASLDMSAQAKTEDMALFSYFSHEGPNNRSLVDFLDEAGYDYLVAGENLAMGFSDAASVMRAWKKSPTHHANLVDSEYEDIGVGIQTGYYQGAPTVFIAQHFGAPVTVSAVRGTKVTDTPKDVTFISDNSRVYWLDAPEGGTLLQVQAHLQGPVISAAAQVGGHTVSLSRHPTSSYFVGSLLVPESSDSFFKPVILPTLTVDDHVLAQHVFTIDWYAPKVLEPTPVEKYIQGKKVLGVLTPLYIYVDRILLAFFVLFSSTLSVYLVIQFRRHNYRLVGQTVGLLVLLVALRLF